MNLVERTEQDIKQKQDWLGTAIRANLLVKALPDDIQQIDAGVDINYDETIVIQFYTEQTEGRKLFVKHGIKKWDKTFNKYDGQYSWEGNAEINDVKVRVLLHNVRKPVNCRVEEYEETVKRFRSICNGEES